MELEKSTLLRRSESNSEGDRPRPGFPRTSPRMSKCHPNWHGRDAWTGFPSRTDSPRSMGGTDTEPFLLHLPSTCVLGVQGVWGRNHPEIFDRQSIFAVIPAEELLLHAANMSSYDSWDF